MPASARPRSKDSKRSKIASPVQWTALKTNVRCRRSLQRYCGAFSIETLRRACSAAARVLPGDLQAQPAIIARLLPSGSSPRGQAMGKTFAAANAHAHGEFGLCTCACKDRYKRRAYGSAGAVSGAMASSGRSSITSECERRRARFAGLRSCCAEQPPRGCASESTMRGSARGRGTPCRGGGARLRW